MIWLSLVAILIALGYSYVKWCNNYWTRRGVPGPRPHPILGSIGEVLFMKKHIGIVYDEAYKEYKDEPYVGLYALTKPTLLIRDPDLVKTVMVKNFSSFHDNDSEVDPKADALFSRNPFVVKGDEWKTIRAQVAPSVTSSKIKTMFPHMVKAANDMCKYLETNTKAKSPEGIEAKDLGLRYTINVVASAGLGLDGEAFTNENSQFVENAKNLFSNNVLTSLKFTIIFSLPFIQRFLNLSLVTKQATSWIIQTVKGAMKYRQESNVKYDDFIDAMIQMRAKFEKSGKSLTDVDVAGNAMTFLVDGTETSSIVLSLALYEVAANHNVQERLRQEINDVLSQHDDQFTYEALKEMRYLEQVIMETLRKYPALLVLNKRCTETFTLPGKDEKSPGLTLEKGMTVIIPVFSLHRDPLYYPDPEIFDPDRFSDEGKESRHNYAFLGFGCGPRICLGMQFGSTQTQVALAHAVKNFHLEVSTKTPPPTEVDPRGWLYTPKEGNFVHFHNL